ncbi:hypothetical protein Ae168Ps1_5377c [Pseudonocardia sp. Ae168_Ps1]|nr:hypothetical protein Ae168Ps1_5377c [Pseudonocardia sp. Ae168_Ps1]
MVCSCIVMCLPRRRCRTTGRHRPRRTRPVTVVL